MSLLTLNNIEVVYDSVFLAVKGVSIEVPEGGLVALLGANGAGKSSVLKAISGLLRAERADRRRSAARTCSRSIRPSAYAAASFTCWKDGACSSIGRRLKICWRRPRCIGIARGWHGGSTRC